MLDFADLQKTQKEKKAALIRKRRELRLKRSEIFWLRLPVSEPIAAEIEQVLDSSVGYISTWIERQPNNNEILIHICMNKEAANRETKTLNKNALLEALRKEIEEIKGEHNELRS